MSDIRPFPFLQPKIPISTGFKEVLAVVGHIIYKMMLTGEFSYDFYCTTLCLHGYNAFLW